MAPRVKKTKTPESVPEVIPETVQDVTPEPVPEVTPEPVQEVNLESLPEQTQEVTPEPEKPNFSNHFDALMQSVVSLTKKCKELEIEVKSLKHLYNKEHKPVKPVVKRKQVQKKQKTECC